MRVAYGWLRAFGGKQLDEWQNRIGKRMVDRLICHVGSQGTRRIAERNLSMCWPVSSPLKEIETLLNVAKSNVSNAALKPDISDGMVYGSEIVIRRAIHIEPPRKELAPYTELYSED